MNKAIMLSMAAGSMFALGAGAAYLFDAHNGKRRRAMIRDKARHVTRKMTATWVKTKKDLVNRTSGVIAEWRSFGHSERPDDRKLECHIRSKLGRLVSHPHSIQVQVVHRVVTLKGLVLAEESERLLHTVRVMEGVKQLHEELLVCKSPAHISGLQGGRPKQTASARFLTRHWSPAFRFGAIVAGAAGFLYGMQRKDEFAFTLALLSTAAVLKGTADHIWGVRHEAIQFEDTIRIYAPLSDVFDFWADPRNYPRAMSHVLKVEKVGENLYHWTVSGPGATSIGWDATITDKIPNTLLAWKSIEGSLVKNEGTAFLDPIYDGSTRLHIRMWYQPPGGLAGRIIAAALGTDPARIIRKDLHQFKLGMERPERLKHEPQHQMV